MGRNVVVHYSEIGIKGDNRGLFERQLAGNIRRALGQPKLRIAREFGRLVLEDVAAPPAVVEERLARAPGIAHFAEATLVPLDMDAIRAEAVRVSREVRAGSFRIETRRSLKRFPLNSMEVSRDAGAAVAAATGMRVDLERPEHVVWIEIAERAALVYTRRVPGPGGLPAGVSGTVVTLMSGGLDSPVAAYRMIRRGCRAVLVHFHNYTRDEAGVREKVLDLARVLARYQLETRLYVVPFADVQAAIVAAVPADARMVSYRRVMLALAQDVLEREGGRAFVTGDSVGQVASQTLDNLQAIYAAARAPVLTPLIGDDKNAIVAEARAIGTFEVSVRPYQDCCSFMVARHPDTRVRRDVLEAREARIPLDELGKQALAAAEVHDLAGWPAAG